MENNIIPNSLWKYFSSAGGLTSMSLFFVNCIIAQGFQYGSSYWLSIWTNSEMIHNSKNYISTEMSWNISTNTGIYVFSGILGGAFIFIVICTTQFSIMCTMSSVKLHSQMFNAVLRSPMSFFDKNPVGMSSNLKDDKQILCCFLLNLVTNGYPGRILNRFTKDTGSMDDHLPATLYNVIKVNKWWCWQNISSRFHCHIFNC